jgi:hypothetical protein
VLPLLSEHHNDQHRAFQESVLFPLGAGLLPTGFRLRTVAPGRRHIEDITIIEFLTHVLKVVNGNNYFLHVQHSKNPWDSKEGSDALELPLLTTLSKGRWR